MTTDSGSATPSRFQTFLQQARSGVRLWGGEGLEGGTDALLRDQPRLADVRVVEATVDGPHGAQPARVYLPASGATGAGLVWAHGGAFIGGDLDMAEAHWVGLAMAAEGVAVVSLEYHKALDEHTRYPVPSDDVLAGWLWALDHAPRWDVDPARLHLGGASAGAGLTAGVTKRLLDGAGAPPASLLFCYGTAHAELPPWSSPEAQARVEGSGARIFTEDSGPEASLNFVGGREGFSDPYAFAANGPVDPAHPPVLAVHDELDSLRRSSEAYARKLREAGVVVREEWEPDAIHGSLNRPTEDGPRTLARLVRWIGDVDAGWIGSRADDPERSGIDG